MSGRVVKALFRKEILELSRNLGVLVPVGVTACLALVLPFALAVLVPTLTGHPLGDDSDLVRISSRFWSVQGLSMEGRVQLFFFDQSVLLFLLLPTTGAMTLAAHSVVSEKQARTLEPLLATPVTTLELLLAKMLGALLPALAISLASVLVYLAGVGWVAEPGVLAALVTARTALLVLLVGPAATLVSLQLALLVSSRANDARTAQQFGVLIVLPLSAALVAQLTGVLWLSTSLLLSAGTGLIVLWITLVVVSVPLFERETILTRWR